MTTDIRTAAQAALSCVEFLPGQYKNSITSDQRAVFDDLRAALAQPEPEPNMRHPKIQALIGSNAHKEIIIGLVEQILDGETDFTALDMEYWDSLHDRAMALMEKAAQPQQAAASDEELGWLIEHRVAEHTLWWSGEFDPADDEYRPARLIARMTNNANAAVRFARKEDAQRVLDAMLAVRPSPILARAPELYSVTEHMWIPAAQPQHIDNITNNKV